MAFMWKNDSTEQNTKSAHDASNNRIGFIDAITRAFCRVFDYTGRSTRAEFWWFILFSAIINSISFQVSNRVFLTILGRQDENGVLVLSIFSSVIIALATLLVWLPLAIRRIRDAGKSPLWITSYILPFALVFGSKLIKDEFQSAFMGLYIIIFWIVMLGMMVIYLMPSKDIRR